MKRILAVLVLISAAGCGGSSSPAAPTFSGAVTRTITISGSLNYGTVVVGDVRTDGQFTIGNTGNSNLTISGMGSPCGGFFTANWLSGTISPGGSQVVNVRFAPTAVQDCSGVVTVNGDQTSGTNTVPLSVTIVAR